MPSATAQPLTPSANPGGRLVSVEGKDIPLKEVQITAKAQAGFAATTVVQVFESLYDQPIEATYQLPLPADGAVGSFRFEVGDRMVEGVVEPRALARERYDTALAAGKTAALLEQERVNLFTQSIGNIPPRAKVVCTITIDHPLDWVETTGSWEFRFPTVVCPHYMGVEGRVEDVERVSVDVADVLMPLAMSFEVEIGDLLSEGGGVVSPSHEVGTYRADGSEYKRAETSRLNQALGAKPELLHVRPYGEESVLDRDIVIQWPVAGLSPGVSIRTARPTKAGISETAYGILTIVPPVGVPVATRRDLTLLIDTSGSMGGVLEWVKPAALALIDSLSDMDAFEVIAFSNEPKRFRPRPVRATAVNKAAAKSWIKKLQAGGATEMVGAILDALKNVHDGSQRQVVVLTDGCIGFEREAIQTVRTKLPPGARLHMVGAGPSCNRALTMGAARAGRGVEVFIDGEKEAQNAAARVVRATASPMLHELVLDGEALLGYSPSHLPDVFAGKPVRVALQLKPEGGKFTVRGLCSSGQYRQEIDVTPITKGEGEESVARLWAREVVEDIEMGLASGDNRKTTEAKIEELGVRFQISTRMTSWVAVSEEPTVDPTMPIKKVKIPQQLPHGLDPAGLGLAHAQMMAVVGNSFMYSAGLASRYAYRGMRTQHAMGGGRAGGQSLGSPDDDMEVLTSAATEPESMTEASTAWPIASPAMPKSLGELKARQIPSPYPGTVVLLVDIDRPFTWAFGPNLVVEITLKDGSTVHARASVTLSTRHGQLSPGDVAKLFLEVADTNIEVSSAKLRIGDGEVIIWL